MVRKKHGIRWSDRAKKGLQNISNYLKYRASADVARKVRGRIILAVRELVDFPGKFCGGAGVDRAGWHYSLQSNLELQDHL